MRRETMTEKRKAWLFNLRDMGIDKRDGWRRVPCDCMHLGWTEWVWTEDRKTIIGERLTDKGLALVIRYS